MIAREGDANGFVEIGGALFQIDILDSIDDTKMGRAGWVGVDDADGIRNVIADPGFEPVGPDRDANRINSHRDP